MESLIEQAARRLEQLRKAGAVVPEETLGSSAEKLEIDLKKPSEKSIQSSKFEKKSQSKSSIVNLNLEALTASGIVSPQSPRSHVADQYRVIKRPLISNAMGRGAATIEHGKPDHGNQCCVRRR